MVKNKFQTIILLLVMAVAVMVLWRHLFPNEEGRIRSMLGSLSSTMSLPEDAGGASALAAADRLRDFFTSEVSINLNLQSEGHISVSSRQEIVQAVIAARSRIQGFKVEFVDVSVVLGEDPNTAIATFTARVTRRGETDALQEIKAALIKENRTWRISRVDSVNTLKL